MAEKLIAIPVSEYEHLLQCKQELMEMHKREIQACYEEMQSQNVKYVVNSFVKLNQYVK